jgi:membrane protease YdiL (CAAX protease family)
MGLITVGLIWQFILSMIIVRREESDLRWATIRQRLWLNTPRDPQTGEPRRKLWLWVIPFTLLLFASFFTIAPLLERLWVSVFPFFAAPAGSNFGEILGSPGILAQLVGNWFFFGLFLVMAVFNIAGEEFLFRGVLLPKMDGVFGNWDWVANGVLMAAYHWHQPYMILGGIVFATLCFSLPARRFRSTWMSIIIHSMQFLLSFPMILAIVLGLT